MPSPCRLLHTTHTLCALLAALLITTALSACGEDRTYTPIRVQVSISNNVEEFARASIYAARVDVSGAVTDSFILGDAAPGTFQYNTGTFEYVTTAESGQLTFTVLMRDFAGATVAQGTTAPVTIDPANAPLETQVVCQRNPNWNNP